MSRRGNCWDNAAESFFSSLKKERIRKRIYKTRDLARADVFEYIEVFYNRTRRLLPIALPHRNDSRPYRYGRMPASVSFEAASVGGLFNSDLVNISIAAL